MTGYCPGCVQLKTRLWTDKKDKLVQELNLWFQDFKKAAASL
jgi:hypothetical protein